VSLCAWRRRVVADRWAIFQLPGKWRAWLADYCMPTN